ncbi:hypothetical protein HYFRA_00010807 [Hymenoscyphus fraxineus]|uniref:Uncharacterized protein n=1 Tax=Hymenoscyphus fraxineus TaxID=746836 RepID=A0A9N9PRX2_9HELO|nr:hypothetical protein HYFRA_00010807 [Hymenoscyphus fraxineus]
MPLNVTRNQIVHSLPENSNPEPLSQSAIQAQRLTVGSPNSATTREAERHGHQPHIAHNSTSSRGNRVPPGSGPKESTFEEGQIVFLRRTAELYATVPSSSKLDHPGIILSIDGDSCEVVSMGSRKDGTSMEIVSKVHRTDGVSNHLVLESEEDYDFNRVGGNQANKKEWEKNGDFVHLRHVNTFKLSDLQLYGNARFKLAPESLETLKNGFASLRKIGKHIRKSHVKNSELFCRHTLALQPLNKHFINP